MHAQTRLSPPRPTPRCTAPCAIHVILSLLAGGPPLYFVPLSCWRLSKKCAQKQESRQQREDTNADMTSSSKDVMAAVGKVHEHEQPEEHWGANGASDCAICGRSLQGFAFVHGVYANDSTHFVGPSQFNILCAVAASSAARARAGATTAAAATGTGIRKSAKGFAEEQKVLTVPSSSCSS